MRREAQDAFERGVNRAADGIRGVAGDRAADTFRNTAMAAEKPVQEAAKYTAGFDEGVVEGIGGMAKGLVNLGGAIYSGANAAGNSTYKFVTDSQFRANAIAAGQQAAKSADKTLRDAATYAVNHPFEAAGQAAIAQGNFAKKIVGAAADAGKEFYNGAVEANNKGNLAGYIGHAEGEAAAFVGSFFVGAGEVSTAAKAGKGLGLFERAGVLGRGAESEAADLILPKSLGAAANITLTSKIGESKYAIRLAGEMSQQAQKDVDGLLEQFKLGNSKPGIGTRPLGNGFFELRGANGGRAIIKRKSAATFDIVGKFQGHVKGDTANSNIIEKLMKDYRG